MRYTQKTFPRSARDLYHLMENEGDDLAKNADFQRRTLSLGWPFYMKKFRAARAAFIISQKNGGMIWRKLQIFSKDNLVWLAILYKHFQRCARGLYHLIEKWGDDLATSRDIDRGKSSLVGFYKHFPRCARSLYHLIILTKMAILKSATNARLHILHGDIFRNCKFNFTKLVVHGYKQLNAILTEMKAKK